MKLVSNIFLVSILFVSFSKTKNWGSTDFELVEHTITNSSQINKRKLLPEILTIYVSYQTFSCECAQWLDHKKDSCFACDKEYIFLEPANKHLANADNLWDGENLPLTLKLTGQYYSGIGFPKKHKANKGNPPPAKVFRYTKIEIISK